MREEDKKRLDQTEAMDVQGTEHKADFSRVRLAYLYSQTGPFFVKSRRSRAGLGTHSPTGRTHPEAAADLLELY